MKNIERYISLFMLIFAVGFNLWLYKLEPTAKIDPNDNPFQYALVDRTNQMWDYAWDKCHINIICFSGYLIDHWVPNWAQGYNLPYYYSHVPQIVIVTGYRLIVQPLSHSSFSLFQWYHLVIFLLLCLFPISIFLAFKVLRTPPLIAGAAAVLASHISTDGLYGLDPSSFLWRGYGLTSQLFAMIWMPVAIAYAYRFFGSNTALSFPYIQKNLKGKTLFQRIIFLKTYLLSFKDFWKAMMFLVLTVSGHLGLGVLTLLSIGILAIAEPIMDLLYQRPLPVLIEHGKHQLIKLTLLSSGVIFFLSYWILPALLYDKYHNYSFWDPVWKFNSWGWREVIQNFFNGALFDFGRGFPILTVLIILGGLAAVRGKIQDPGLKKTVTEDSISLESFYPFSFLFLFWLMMFFGRTTWGGLLDIIPSMKEFHQSRFIVGVHVGGFFLAPFGLWFLADILPAFVMKIKNVFSHGLSALKHHHQYVASPLLIAICSGVLTVLVVFVAYPQTIRYSEFNDVLIKRGNENFDKQNANVETLISALKKSSPGRTYTGRGGAWGKELQIAETTYFMHLSTYGIPVILWLPETWSPNSDVEQFFIEEWKEHYDLMNIKYVVAPPKITPQAFWQLKTQTPDWKLYEVPTSGYFGTGSHAAVVYASKFDYINLVRLWLQSDYPKNHIYPELTFSKKTMMNSQIPAFEMTDEASYRTRDGKEYGLFGDVPRYEAPAANLTTSGESSNMDMEFSTKVAVNTPCERCMVFLKQSFHPNWKAWIDGKPAETFISFPFYTAVTLTSPGTHTIEFKYQPSSTKMLLFSTALVTGLFLILPWEKLKKVNRSNA